MRSNQDWGVGACMCEAPPFHQGPRPFLTDRHARCRARPARISFCARVKGRFHCRHSSVRSLRELFQHSILLLMPFGFHLAMDTLPSGESHLRPTTHYRRLWIWRPHSSARGTLTLLNNALLSAHYALG